MKQMYLFIHGQIMKIVKNLYDPKSSKFEEQIILIQLLKNMELTKN